MHAPVSWAGRAARQTTAVLLTGLCVTAWTTAGTTLTNAVTSVQRVTLQVKVFFYRQYSFVTCFHHYVFSCYVMEFNFYRPIVHSFVRHPFLINYPSVCLPSIVCLSTVCHLSVIYLSSIRQLSVIHLSTVCHPSIICLPSILHPPVIRRPSTICNL